MIFGDNQLKRLKLELNLKFWNTSIIAKQIEIWKYDKYEKTIQRHIQDPLRKKRIGPALWKVNNKEIITQFGGGSLKIRIIFQHL